MSPRHARELLVVAGEGSGDLLAAPVVRALGVPAFGLGGPELARAGADLVAVLGPVAAMGVSPVLRRAPRIAAAALSVLAAAFRRRPRAALLVGFSELNARLASWLGRRGTSVLWYAPPQVWAWRPGRATALARVPAHLAVLLPFEEAIWRRAGARVTYVGHPAAAHTDVREGRTPPRLALLPGSRTQEVRAHLLPLLDAANLLGMDTTVVRAPALDLRTARWLEETARARGSRVDDRPVPEALAGACAAVVASGTATLECATLGVPPVIVYRTDALTHAVARRLVRVDHVGLPNLLLGRRAFPELIQGDLTPGPVAREVRRVLAAPEGFTRACDEVRAVLRQGLDDRAPAARVSAILEPWLA